MHGHRIIKNGKGQGSESPHDVLQIGKKPARVPGVF